MKLRYIFAVLVLLLCGTATRASDLYFAQNSAGGATGTNCLNAYAWNDGTHGINLSAQQQPGNTLHLCGSFVLPAATPFITAVNSGTSGNPITVIFETGAYLQEPYFSNGNSGVITLYKNWWVLNGGTNGFIQSTLNGTAGSSCVGGPCTTQNNNNGVYMGGNNNIVENLGVYDTYDQITTDSVGNTNAGTGIFIDASGNHGGPVGATNIELKNNTIHDAGICTNYIYSNNDTGINIHNNNLSRCGWSMGVESSGANVLTLIKIHDEHWHDNSNWGNGPSHVNGLHSFNTSAGVSGGIQEIDFYNNLIDGAFGNMSHWTSPVYLEWNSTTDHWVTPTGQLFAWNNIINMSNATGGNSNGAFQDAGGTNHFFLNNYVYGVPGGVPCLDFGTTTNLTIENNVFQGCGQIFSANSGTTTFATVDYNVYGSASSGNPLWQVSGIGSSSTLAGWRTACSCDSHSIAPGFGADLSNITTAGVPSVGFVGLSAGVNLTSSATGNRATLAFSTTDGGSISSPAARPSSAAWDIGAYVGGNCPTGAQYYGPITSQSQLGNPVTAASLGCTSAYYFADNGSDSNDGKSEASGHPFLHAAGMPNCTANCASASNGPGVWWIAKGNDTWHFGNSGSSPYTGGTWGWPGPSGTAAHPVYIGVDQNWFSGGSWGRPILNQDNSLSTSTVSSCSFTTGGSNIMVNIASVNYTYFDNFEFTGYCWSNQGLPFGSNQVLKSNGASNTQTGSNNLFENLYVHGWTYTVAGGQAIAAAIAIAGNYGGSTIQFNVIDGSDTDQKSMSAWGQSMDGYNVQYNYDGHHTAQNVSNNCHYIHDNIFEYQNNPTDGTGHGDIIFCFGTYAAGTSSPNLFYNNVYRHIGTQFNQAISYPQNVSAPTGQTTYFFNEVAFDAQPNSGNGIFELHDNQCNNCAGSAVFFNNTASTFTATGDTGCIICPGAGTGSVTLVNNHWISASGSQSSFWTSPSITELAHLYMTNATATSQGYTSSNNFAPTLSSNSTVTGAGTNETTGYCADSVLHNALAESYCVQGTTNGCSYNNSTHTLSCPSLPASPKLSSGNWQFGAYWFGANVSLSPSSADCGSQLVGQTQPCPGFTLTNNTSSTDTGIAVTSTGGNASDFTRTGGNCGASLGAGGNCSIIETFTPGAAGARTSTVSVSGSAPGSPQTATISGTGISATVTISPSFLAFGNVLQNTPSAAQNVTVSNQSGVTIGFTSNTFSGTNGSDFTRSGGTCGSMLANGVNCTMGIVFTPTGTPVLNETGSVTVGYSGFSGPALTVSLTGTSVSATPPQPPTNLGCVAQ